MVREKVPNCLMQKKNYTRAKTSWNENPLTRSFISDLSAERRSPWDKWPLVNCNKKSIIAATTCCYNLYILALMLYSILAISFTRVFIYQRLWRALIVSFSMNSRLHLSISKFILLPFFYILCEFYFISCNRSRNFKDVLHIRKCLTNRHSHDYVRRTELL